MLLVVDASHLGQVLSKLGKIIEWKTLGLNLGLLRKTLDTISEEGRDRVDKCTSDMLNAWFKWNDNVDSPDYGRPSWKRLLEALDPIDHELAKKIESSKPWISKRE